MGIFSIRQRHSDHDYSDLVWLSLLIWAESQHSIERCWFLLQTVIRRLERCSYKCWQTWAEQAAPFQTCLLQHRSQKAQLVPASCRSCFMPDHPYAALPSYQACSLLGKRLPNNPHALVLSSRIDTDVPCLPFPLLLSSRTRCCLVLAQRQELLRTSDTCITSYHRAVVVVNSLYILAGNI